jgi:DNA (cytosine-5)-methyltransferase 1
MYRVSLKAVDFFCGAGGMSLGLTRAGISVVAGIDNSPECRDTFETNIKGAKYIKHDISTLSAPELKRRLNLSRNDPHLIFAGCSPCQFWSKIRTDKSKAKKTAFLLQRFEKFIRYFLPGFVVVENVPGLLKQRKKSILPDFIAFLEKLGYKCKDGLINANHYGVPQHRIRYLLIASRVTGEVSLPLPEPNNALTVRSVIGAANGFSKINAGYRDLTNFQHTACALSEKNLRRIRSTEKSGGARDNWKNDPELQLAAYVNRDGMFRDVYARMYWDRPSPTITTRFNSLSNGRFGHPEEDRAISIREGATLQTFPKDFVFYGGSLSKLARQIGNAVPPNLAERIGKHLIRLYGKI